MLPAFSARLEQAAGTALTDIQLERLTALVFLHDAGKLHPGFQARGWPGETWRVRSRGHVPEGLEVFLAADGVASLPLAHSLHIDTLGEWGIGSSLLRSVISHHGRPAPKSVANLNDARESWRATAAYDPAAAAADLGRLMPHWFESAFAAGGQRLPYDNGAFEHLVCGLTTLADWLGSSIQWFPHSADLDENYIDTAHNSGPAPVSWSGLMLGSCAAE